MLPSSHLVLRLLCCRFEDETLEVGRGQGTGEELFLLFFVLYVNSKVRE